MGNSVAKGSGQWWQFASEVDQGSHIGDEAQASQNDGDEKYARQTVIINKGVTITSDTGEEIIGGGATDQVTPEFFLVKLIQ